MAIKSILISSGSAKRTAVPNNAFTYDTDTQYVSINNLSSSQLVLTGAVSGVLISSGGVVTAYKASENSGSYLVTDGTKWTVGSAGNASIGPVSGDLSGSYPNPKFRNIGNVNTGTLPIARGGFSGSGNYNLLSAIPSGSLILASGTGSLTVVSTASYVAAGGAGDAWVLGSVSGTTQWAAVTASAPAQDANVQFFTCSTPTVTTTGSWVKQNPNHQWARVMLQGGGGGGGGVATAPLAYYASGGSGGGFTDIVVYIGNILSASVTVGAGSTGSYAFSVRANTGGSSSFSASNIFVSAGGGGGGVWVTNVGIDSLPGIGLTYEGGVGSAWTGTTGTNGGNSSGAGGGGSSAGVSISSVSGGISGMYYTNTAGGISTTGPKGGSGSFTPNLFGYNIPIGFGSGGGSVSYANIGDGGDGILGSGGGGSARSGGRGGNGGGGFVVVVSY